VAIRIYKDKEFELLDGVYDPSEDSFMLADAALAEVKAGEKVLEIGTGSGVVSLFLKDHADVIATDISPLACENARRNGVEVVRADLYYGICGPFDLVIFNPPYLPTADEDRLGSWLDYAEARSQEIWKASLTDATITDDDGKKLLGAVEARLKQETEKKAAAEAEEAAAVL
jgi:tRNA1(Val) A37 N6-methylase TrmN6